eukprot:gene1824-2048_t
MSIKLKKCGREWFLKLCFQDLETKKIMHLAVFADLVQDIALMCHADLQTIAPPKFTEMILEIDTVNITYDNIQKKLLTISA